MCQTRDSALAEFWKGKVLYKMHTHYLYNTHRSTVAFSSISYNNRNRYGGGRGYRCNWRYRCERS